MTGPVPEGALAPWREAFARASQESDIVPVAYELHTDTLTPVGAFERFVGSAVGFLLESVEDGQRFGRYSFLGRRPLGVHVGDGDGPRATGVLASHGRVADPFRVVEAFLAHTVVADPVGVPALVAPLHAGVVGLFGWECVRHLERLPPEQPSASRQPTSALLVIGELVVFDHWRQTVTLIANVETRGLAVAIEDVEAQIRAMADDLAKSAPEFLRRARTPHEMTIAPYKRLLSSTEFMTLVRAAKEEIANGEVFQIVLSQRFDLGPVADPFAVYRMLRQLNPSAYLYDLQLDEVRGAGSSPEPLVRVRDRRVTVRPIAGSRPRGEDERENRRREASLREDPKELAEHVMLVDLGRNDVGRVAKYGSVVVEELMTVERFSHIMHLTSQVSGEVRDGVSTVDVLRATFPAGTLSGAPKVRAMELITTFEPESRGLYGGAVGYFDVRGNLDAAILIRTLVVDREGRGSVQTGAGIVWDSDPALEDEECLAKAEAVLRAVGGATDG
jgi:anthranilate synthase component I